MIYIFKVSHRGSDIEFSGTFGKGFFLGCSCVYSILKEDGDQNMLTLSWTRTQSRL